MNTKASMTDKKRPTQPNVILFIDHTPFAGGAQLVLADHIAELDKKLFKPIVACTNTIPDLPKRYAQAGAEVEIVDMPRLKGSPRALLDVWRSSRQIKSIMHQYQVDLVVTNTTRASYIGSLAIFRSNTKLIWWVRDALYPKKLFRLLRRLPGRIICVSLAIKRLYMTEDDPQGEVVYVANSIYQKMKTITDQDIQQERRKWGFDQQQIVVGFMGRLVAEKGPLDLILAAEKLKSDYPQLRVLVVGTGQGQMNDVEHQLHQLVEQRQLSTIVKFAGYQPNEPLYYSLFDIYCLTTRDFEPFATTVVQAMMAGKPVIGTDAGGTRELVFDRQTGLLIPPFNVEALAQAIKTLLDDQNLRQSIAQTGQDRVLQYHREEQVTDHLEKIYRQVLT